MYLIIAVVLVLILLTRSKRSDDQPNHWHHSAMDFHCSTDEFYELLTQKLEEIELPGVGKPSVKTYAQSIAGARRKYLRVKRKGIVYDICAAPFGSTYFWSYWQIEEVSFLHKLLERIKGLFEVVNSKSYYSWDTQLMFQGAVHGVLTEAIEQVLKEKGARGMTELEKRPMMNGLFSR